MDLETIPGYLAMKSPKAAPDPAQCTPCLHCHMTVLRSICILTGETVRGRCGKYERTDGRHDLTAQKRTEWLKTQEDVGETLTKRSGEVK